MLLKKLPSLIIICLSLSSCEKSSLNKKNTTSHVNKNILTINMIKSSLDKTDLENYSRTKFATLEAIPSGRTASWENSISGNSGSFTPAKIYKTTDGRFCRNYSETLLINGKLYKGDETACRNITGNWKIVQ